MKAVQYIILTITMTLFIANTSFANKIGDKLNKLNTSTNTTTESGGNKHLKGVMVFDKVPVMDKDICDLELNFDIIVEGTKIELFNKSVGDFSNVEVMYGDGKISNDFDYKHQYEEKGVHYIAVSIYDNTTGCIDFVGANVFVGADESLTIINSSDLNPNEVSNLPK